MTSFEKISSTKVGSLPVQLWQSRDTGMRVCLVTAPGPLVHAALALSTEAVTNEYADRHDGLPHTLEHLVFLGSEDHPYKGLLDQLANRCFAQGTNAWTATDHTAYTVTTVGADGFLILLPVYLEHILYPTLTDSGFVTEVHHINGEGENAGVVYCEMQARENTGPSLTSRRMQDLLYPDPDCGYSSETGGMLANLRNLTVEGVRHYHRDYYRPDNLCVIVVGPVEPAELFRSLQPVEAKIMAKKRSQPEVPRRPRPWMRPVRPWTLPTGATVKRSELTFPTDDEDNGIVLVGWRGPQWRKPDDLTALHVLWTYLTDSPVAPLQQRFVELDEPLCNDVTFHLERFSTSSLQVEFHNVKTELLGAVESTLLEELRAQAEGALDMERLRTVVSRMRLQLQSQLEDAPHEVLLDRIIGHFLYAPRENTAAEAAWLRDSVDVLAALEALPLKDSDAGWWRSFLRQWALEAPRVVVVGRPSADMAQRMVQEEKQRVRDQATRLGAHKLRELATQLEAACRENSRVPDTPEHFPSPSLHRVEFQAVASVRRMRAWEAKAAAADDRWVVEASGSTPEGERACASVLEHLRAAGLSESSGLPVFLQIDHVRSNFVQVTATLDTRDLAPEQRLLLPLLRDLLAELPVNDETEPGMVQSLTYEQVVERLQQDTIEVHHSLGMHGEPFGCGTFAQLLVVALKVEQSKLQQAVDWLRRLLFCTQFTVERLRVGANKLLAEVASFRRRGHSVCRALLHDTLFSRQHSNHNAVNGVRQYYILQRLVHRLDTEPDAVVREMNDVRKAITSPECIRLHLACDVLEQANPIAPLARLLPVAVLRAATARPSVPRSRVQLSQELPRTLDGLSFTGTATVLALPGLESSFLLQACAGPDRADHPALPALLAATEYLTALEGDFWRQIRGQGLAYSYHITSDTDKAQTYFLLYRSADIKRSQEVARRIVGRYADAGVEALEDQQVQAAKSSLVYEIVRRESTPLAAAQQSLLSFLRGERADYQHRLVRSITAASKADMHRAMRTYLSHLFDPAKSVVVVAAAPSKASTYADALRAQDFRVRHSKSLDQLCADDVASYAPAPSGQQRARKSSSRKILATTLVAGVAVAAMVLLVQQRRRV